jgi:hypothetical protein
MSSKQIINCPNCFKIYKKKRCYENHIFQCERETVNTSEKNLIPKLMGMIENLIENQNKMQLEIDNLKASLNRKNKKINVIEWLNEKENREENFTEEWKKIELSEKDLLIIFDKGFVKGISEILNNIFTNLNTIKCFNEKKNIIYTLKNEKWDELRKEEWEEIIKMVNSQMLVLFKKYQDQNLEQLEHEGYHKKLNIYLSKILCVELPFETKCNRIKNNVYNSVKQGFKNIIELQID